MHVENAVSSRERVSAQAFLWSRVHTFQHNRDISRCEVLQDAPSSSVITSSSKVTRECQNYAQLVDIVLLPRLSELTSPHPNGVPRAKCGN
jgi:hypothetical protein